MDAFNQLLAQYSFGDVFFILILLVICTKVLGDAIQWIYGKVKNHFRKDAKNEEVIEKQYDLDKKIDLLSEKVDDLCGIVSSVEQQNKVLQNQISDLDKKNDAVQGKVSKVEEQEKNIQEHLQNYTRAFIIDKYHHYCYQTKMIDDISLQSLEVCYLYYKSRGGNSFIDGLMERIRKLPRVNMENASIEGGE